MPTRRLNFEGGRGHELSARLEMPPSGEPLAWALFAHCFTCSKNIRAAVDVTRALSGLGIAVLRFDFTGLGESEGDFGDTGFSSNVEDLVAAADFMARELHPPSVLVGHSLGGAAVLHAATSIPTVNAVATIGAPAEPAHVLRHMEGDLDEIEREGEATVRIGGRAFRISHSFVEDLGEDRMTGCLTDLDAARLIFHAPRDEVVGIDNAERLYTMARHPKSFVSLDDADHLLSRAEDSVYVGRVLAAWASRYVGTRADEADEDELRAGDRVVTRTERGSYRTDVQVRRHALVADEPVSVGGGDEGPTPYDYVVAGLGACTSMTLEMYAQRKAWPLEQVRVRLKHRKVHRRDRDAAEDERLDEVTREIELHGPLDDEQRARLMEIADRCPVHRTLDAGVRIETRERPSSNDEDPDSRERAGASD